MSEKDFTIKKTSINPDEVAYSQGSPEKKLPDKPLERVLVHKGLVTDELFDFTPKKVVDTTPKDESSVTETAEESTSETNQQEIVFPPL